MDVYSSQEQGEVVGASSPTILVPEPELITRTDALSEGQWTVFSTPPSATSAFAVIDQRVMSVPTSHDEVTRHIQAHELTHAKISPSEKEMEKVWLKRGYASSAALIAVEELRVHSWLQHQGFEPERFIQNGAGQFIASRTATFQEAVLNAVRFTRTAEYQPFMNMLARNHPEWVLRVEAICEGASKIFDDVLKGKNSNQYTQTGKFPRHGFRFTEMCAHWVEQMAEAHGTTIVPKPQPNQFEENHSRDGKSAEAIIKERANEMSEGITEGWQQSLGRPLADMWHKLNVATPMLTRNAVGSIGKKRTAAQFGKNPRRISRLYSDPQMRIFDRVTRGEGGVVLIDFSGSMYLSETDVKSMLEAAPSATVAFYSAGNSKADNLYVIGRKGKMVDKLPTPHGGNGVDGPALEWAVKQRKSLKDPVIWVSDGGVTGKHDFFDERLSMECIRICQRNGIYVVPTALDAISMLNALKRGEKITSIVPYELGRAYENQTGLPLSLR